MRKLKNLAGWSLSLLPLASFADFDTAPIEAVKSDMLTAAGALLSLGVAVWGAMKIVRMFHGR
jgi:hypothetical protein